jgi:glucose-1-phosphate adenylyltransferase
VTHSVLFAGVQVGKGACVRNSIIMHDSLVGEEGRVEDAIIDKRCRLGPKAVVGRGDRAVVNRRFPGHLDSGITVIGKGAILPARIEVGKNCIVNPGADLASLAGHRLEDGETVPA